MKQVVATILSLSVLVAGSALAAPTAVSPAAPVPAVATTPASASANPAAVAGRAPAAQAQPGQGRHHKGPDGHRRELAAGSQGPRQLHAGRHHRHEGMHRRGGPGMARDHGQRRLQLGAPLAENRQGVVVTEHRRHGLQKAPRGQEWRRIGERYVRVTSGSNVVNEIVINGM